MLPFFTRYVALGDSMSIDLYPALDAGEIDVAVALERDTHAGRVAPLGAASLLYQNDDARYPESQGEDLGARYPGIRLQNLALDGATIGDVFGEQLLALDDESGPTLVTLTAGGNDLLSAMANRPRASLLESIAQEVMDAYDFLVASIRRDVPESVIVLTSIYDPSDGTGRIPGVLEGVGVLPLHILDAMNAHIRSLADDESVLYADAHSQFLGHGVSAPEADRWYWRRSLVEPSAAGADALRRLWLSVLDAADSAP
ncbi:MAG TPA: SGNH/GDSL hydrolase family protein [Gemmatimonadaceae bacterium]